MYTKIETQDVSSVSSVSFTSIPSTYTDLRVVYAGYNDAPLVRVNFNGDTANHGVIMLMANGTSVASAGYGTPYLYVWTPGAGLYFNFGIDILNYASTNMFKSWLSRCDISHEAGGPTLASGCWRSTSAINRVDFATTSLTMSGTFTLYGIKAA